MLPGGVTDSHPLMQPLTISVPDAAAEARAPWRGAGRKARPMTSTLTISRLTKRFEDVAALTDVSVSVAAGERVALLGHNGAGKSTMMKIIPRSHPGS